jgi:hypothetical protein
MTDFHAATVVILWDPAISGGYPSHPPLVRNTIHTHAYREGLGYRQPDTPRPLNLLHRWRPVSAKRPLAARGPKRDREKQSQPHWETVLSEVDIASYGTVAHSPRDSQPHPSPSHWPRPRFGPSDIHPQEPFLSIRALRLSKQRGKGAITMIGGGPGGIPSERRIDY